MHTLHSLLITFVPTPVIIKASTGSGTRLFYTPRIYINALCGFTHHHNPGSEYLLPLYNNAMYIFTEHLYTRFSVQSKLITGFVILYQET